MISRKCIFNRIEIFIWRKIDKTSSNVLEIKKGKVRGGIKSRYKKKLSGEIYYGGGYASLKNSFLAGFGNMLLCAVIRPITGVCSIQWGSHCKTRLTKAFLGQGEERVRLAIAKLAYQWPF